MKQIEKARQLLPWYITGRLSSSEVKLVKEAISSCPSLCVDYEEQQKLSQILKEKPQLMDVSVISTQEQRMDALMQRIHAEKQDQDSIAKAMPSLPFFYQAFEGFKEWSKQIMTNIFVFPTNRWAFSAVASVVLIQVTMLSFLLNKQENKVNQVNDYEVMSDDILVKSNKNRIIVSFDQKATAADKLDILQAIDKHIVEHSSDSTFYTLIFSEDMTTDQLDALLVKMKHNKLIQFVGKGF